MNAASEAAGGVSGDPRTHTKKTAFFFEKTSQYCHQLCACHFVFEVPKRTSLSDLIILSCTDQSAVSVNRVSEFHVSSACELRVCSQHQGASDMRRQSDLNMVSWPSIPAGESHFVQTDGKCC